MFFDDELQSEEKIKGQSVPKLLETDPYDDDVETYTVKEVMELLKVSRKTVYNLMEKGKLLGQTYFIDGRNRILFTRVSVDDYHAAQNPKDLVTVPVLAKRFNTSNAQIFNLLKKHGISFELNSTDFSRKTATLSTENERLFVEVAVAEWEKESKQRAPFIHKGYAMYQAFINPVGKIQRLLYLGSQWGFSFNDKFISIEDALNNGFRSMYWINTKSPATRGKYYAKFTCAKSETTDEWIDFLYQNIKMRDMHVELQGDFLNISVKALNLDLTDYSFKYVTHQWLRECLVIGDVEYKESKLILHGSHRYIGAALPIDVVKSLDEKVQKSNLSSAVIIDRALRLYLTKDKEANKNSNER